MFDAILNPVRVGDPVLGRLPALKEFHLVFPREGKVGRVDIIDAIRRCAKCCACSLEIWRVSFSFRIPLDAEELGELFGLFQVLKVIYLPADSVLGWEYKDKSQQGACARSLASRCPALEYVYFTYKTDLVMAVWEVLRVSGQVSICRVRP
jgi:hypothetical protein